jgi:hypothetical protein
LLSEQRPLSSEDDLSGWCVCGTRIRIEQILRLHAVELSNVDAAPTLALHGIVEEVTTIREKLRKSVIARLSRPDVRNRHRLATATTGNSEEHAHLGWTKHDDIVAVPCATRTRRGARECL